MNQELPVTRVTGGNPTPKRRRVGPWMLGLALFALLALWIFALSSPPVNQASAPAAGPPPAPAGRPPVVFAPPVFAPSAHQVVYEISGTAKGALSISYSTDGPGSIEQVTDAKLPWSKTINVLTGGLAIVSINAQNSGSGSITCKIIAGGKVIQQATSSGQYAIASCSGSLSG